MRWENTYGIRINALTPDGRPREEWLFINGNHKPEAMADFGRGMEPQGRIETLLLNGMPVISWDNPMRFVYDMERMIADVKERYGL